MTTNRVAGARLHELGPADLPGALALFAQDPVGTVMTEARVRVSGLNPQRLGASVWGFGADGVWESICHVGANLIPMLATPAALDAFAARAWIDDVNCATLLGRQDDVAGLWDRLGGGWAQPRDLRWEQPLMELRGATSVTPDPLVLRTAPFEFDQLYPACVAMHVEELGVSPEAGGSTSYRLRVRQLIRQGLSFRRIEDGVVVFKAEIAAATPSACQIQGVWVHPDFRGKGLATHGVATVATIAQRTLAPVVSLYVNDFNVAAQRAYHRAGFRRTGTFASILF